MKDYSKRSLPLSKDALQLIRGLIIGKVLTLVVIGGLWMLLRPRLWVENNVSYSQDVDTGSAPAASTASTFQTVSDVPIGTFKYGGSTAWAPIRQLVNSQIQSSRPELQLRYVDPDQGRPGSSEGIRMLLNGKLDFAESSRPLTKEEYAIAQQQGFTLEQRQIATDAIAVVVNPELEVSGLTVKQLQQIYSGKITNWKQVGGPNLPITPFSTHSESADTLFSSEGALEEQTPNSNVKQVYSTTEALRQISRTPGGIYYASARAVVPQCSVKALPLGKVQTQLISPYREPLVAQDQCPFKRNQVNTEVIKNGSYPIVSKLFLIIKQNKGQEQKIGEAYTKLLLTDEGKKAIEQAGFVPVR